MNNNKLILENDLKSHNNNIQKQKMIEAIKCDNENGGIMWYAGFSQVDQHPLFYSDKSNSFVFHCINQYNRAIKTLQLLGYKIIE